MMTKEEYRDLLSRNNLRQVDVSWMTGVGERHARSWALGRYPVPQYAQIILRAYDEGLIDGPWLVRGINRPVP